MKFEKIKILKNAPFKPHTIISKKLISQKIQDYIKIIIQQKKNNKFQILRGKFGDIKGIAKFYNISLEIKKYKPTAGLAIFSDRRILISTVYANTQSIIRATFCHELIHIIQYDLGIINPIESNSLSSSLRTEQEAEAAGAVIFKILFPNFFFSKKLFQNYFSEKHILYLHGYLKCPTNDLFEWL